MHPLVLLLLLGGAYATGILGPRKRDRAAGTRHAMPTRIVGAATGRPAPGSPAYGAAIEAACAKAGLSPADCELAKQGRWEDLAGRGVDALCDAVDVPGCASALGYVVDAAFGDNSSPLSRSNALNAALNGASDRGVQYAGPGYVATIRFRNGCVPLAGCPEFAECAPGTIDLSELLAARGLRLDGCGVKTSKGYLDRFLDLF